MWLFRDVFAHFVSLIEELFQKEESWLLIFALGIFGSLLLFLQDLLLLFLKYLLYTWWFWLFCLLLAIFESLWLYWRQELFKRSIEWTLLELRMPREVKKNPQAMEQILIAMHSLRNAPKEFSDKYIKGEVTRWFSLEIVSFGGEVHFYVRTPMAHRHIIEATFFSYYPDVEVSEVKDYAEAFPGSVQELVSREFDVWGTEMVLAREDAYPIKTYAQFGTQKDEGTMDPISTLLEVLAKIKREETFGIQMLIAGAAPAWREKWERVIIDLQKPATITTKSATGKTETPIGHTPGKTELLKAVESNLSKPAFDMLIRVMYLSPKSLFSESFIRGGVMTAFNQYSSVHLNSFKPNSATNTQSQLKNLPHHYSELNGRIRKQRALYNYRKREVPPETAAGKFLSSGIFGERLINTLFGSKRFVMNIEGIATLFHPPTAIVVTGPHIQRVTSRKTGPPAGLAIFGEEEEIEHFK